MKLLQCYQNPWCEDSLIIPIPNTLQDPNEWVEYPVLTIWKPERYLDPMLDYCFLSKDDLRREKYSSEYPYVNSLDIYKELNETL